MNTTIAALLMIMAVSAQAATLTEALTDPVSKAAFAENMKVQGDQKETDDQYKARLKKGLLNPPPVTTPAPTPKSK